MKKFNCTKSQMLLLDKNDTYRDCTIDVALKLNCHIDIDLFNKAINEEIKRNEGLRIHVFRKVFKWYTEVEEPFLYNQLKVHNLKGKTVNEIEEYIDNICGYYMVFKNADCNFEYHIIDADDYNYVLFRVFHSSMDAYAALLSISDTVKVYFSLLNNTVMPKPLSSVEEYLQRYEDNYDNYVARVKEDNKFFVDYQNKLGQPTYLGVEGGFDGSHKMYKMKALFGYHPCSYYNDSFNCEVSKKVFNYCKEYEVNLASLFLGTIELYYSAVNNDIRDVSMFYTSNLRAKLSDKKLPFTTSTAVFFRRIIDDNLNFKDFIKSCDNDYLTSLKHWAMYITDIYKYLFTLDLKHGIGRYDQLVFSFIPSDFEGLPKDLIVEPYLPKLKQASDFLVYYIVVPNKDGSLSASYRYYNDLMNEEHLKKLHFGLTKAFDYAISNPNASINDIMKIMKEA